MSGLNFGNLGRPSVADTVLPPRRIFNALPKKNARYNYARDVQAEVWEQWEVRRSDSDLVVKMNTGSGKTLVGLMMLKSGLNEKVGPSAYVAPNKHLASQVRAEAEGLGLAVTDNPRSAAFQDGRAILVTHVHRVVNGRSVFGVAGDGRTPVRIGSLLIDDAHASLATVQDAFTLGLPSDTAAYRELQSLFAPALKGQSAALLQDILDGDTAAVLRVPYWDWRGLQDQALGILQRYKGDAALEWSWPLVSNDLAHCDVAFSATRAELRAAVLPIDRIPSFVSATRRIYMTATLADDSILVTHFGANPDTLREPLTPSTAADLGERMILAPLETHPNVSVVSVQRMLAEKAKRVNVVVVAPSTRRTQMWTDVADVIADSESIEATVAALRQGHVGLVVFNNRYDGIDLPGDACRILVIDGVPEAYGALDRVEMLALEHSQAATGRQIQRIEQGMGRGIRSKDDYCVVVLLDHRLTQRIHGEQNLSMFSPGTRAQLEVSQSIAEALEDRPFREISVVIDQALDRDSAWVEMSIQALDGLEHEAATNISPVSEALSTAYADARRGQYSKAGDLLARVSNNVDDPRRRGWIKQQAAMMRDFHDPVKAQALQTSAVNDNPYLLKPLAGIAYRRVKAHANQARAVAEVLATEVSDANETVVRVAAILSDLAPIPDPTGPEVHRFERAVVEVARRIGFVGQNPELDLGEGPDALWSLGNLEYAVIECKSGATASAIGKRDLAQLSHSVDWFADRYDTSCSVTPVMIHPAHAPGPEAVARQGARIMTFDLLADFLEAVRTFTAAVVQQPTDEASIGAQLVAHHLTPGLLLDRYTRPPTPS